MHKPPKVFMLDDDGDKVFAGDMVKFTYGIPAVLVIAQIIQRGNSLTALTPGHTPAQCSLRKLRGYVGSWFKHNA